MFTVYGSTASMKEGIYSWGVLKACNAYLSFIFTNVLIVISLSDYDFVALRIERLG